MSKIKIKEWLVGIGLIPQGSHQHYRSEYIIDTSDIERIYSDMEELAEKNSSMLAIECDSVNHTIVEEKLAGNNILGDQLIHEKWCHSYSLTEDNKVYVIDENWD